MYAIIYRIGGIECKVTTEYRGTSVVTNPDTGRRRLFLCWSKLGRDFEIPVSAMLVACKLSSKPHHQTEPRDR